MNIHSLRFKITAITVTAILSAILCVVLASYPTVHEETNRRSVEIMRLICDDTANTLDHSFVFIEQSVKMAANVAMDSLDTVTLAECGLLSDQPRTAQQTERLDAYLEEHCAHVLRTFQGVGSHTFGVSAYYYCLAPEVSSSRLGFYYSRVGKAGFVALDPIDVSALDPDDPDHNSWYFTALQKGRPCWVGPFRNLYEGDIPICSYLVPVYSAGVMVGLVGMDIPLETMVAQISSIQVYDTGYATLFSEDRSILYHPELQAGSTVQVSDLSVSDDFLQQKSSGNQLIRYSYGGVLRQMAYTTLENGMSLVISAPVREINASWLQLLRVVSVITLVVVLVFAFAILLVMQLVTRPLLRLTAAAQRLSDEEYNVSLDYRGHDEIGKLTEAFVKMRDRLKDYIDDLNRRINTDLLTGLPNQSRFNDLALAERQRLLAQGKNPVILFFDITGMKYYNRQYGHEKGDQLLIQVGQLLAQEYGAEKLCRLSEDHFAVVCDEERLEERIQSIFRSCEQVNGGNTLPLRVGVYQVGAEEISVSEACDRAKYACDKNRGSFVSGYCYFDGEMLKQLDGVRYVINHLDQALAERWIKVYYQPIIRAVNGRVCDEEALSRWVDPEKGMFSPAVFIPILENARLIYKVDLYVLDRILEKMQDQIRHGIPVVPHSLNLSRADFDACDVVEEIRHRVDRAGIPRDRLTIEITESVIGSDFDFMQEQVKRFQELGFRVWMDDFGSGYSSLDVLQDVHFDLIKFDMRFMRRFDEGEESKIILTDLIRMAIDLGLDTVCEGVETAEEAEFLREVGCSKLQGFHFSKPVPYEEILSSYKKGTGIGTEDPACSEYYSAIGRVNLYALTTGDSQNEDHFDPLPVGILELCGDHINYVRTNRSYREFLRRYYRFDLDAQTADYPAFGTGKADDFLEKVRQCAQDGSRILFEGRLPNGSIVHTILSRVGVNPVNHATAVATAVLSVAAPDRSTTYAEIARSLAADYYQIYVVNMDNDKFIEYSSRVGKQELAVERHGTDFFWSANKESYTRVYEEDQEHFRAWFNRENILRVLKEQGVFTITYRMTDYGSPMYVTTKVSTLPGSNRIIVGVSLVDSEMKQKAHYEELQKDRDTMVRIMALADGYLSLFTVDPETGNYVEYSSTDAFDALGAPKAGDDFYAQALIDAKMVLYPPDQEEFIAKFTKENILRDVREKGCFKIHYRLMLEGEPRDVTLKVAPFREGEAEKLVVGIRVWTKQQ